MKLFSLFFELMCMTNNNNKINNKINNENRYSSFFNANNIMKLSNVSGIDHRPLDIIDNDEQLIKINTNMLKKNILDTLINTNISSYHKIDLINRYDIFNKSMNFNILEGGLLDDYNFEL